MAEVVLSDGTALRARVAHARGSSARPMTDAELDAKFLSQASLVLSPQRSDRLLALVRGIAAETDVGQAVAAALQPRAGCARCVYCAAARAVAGRNQLRRSD